MQDTPPRDSHRIGADAPLAGDSWGAQAIDRRSPEGLPALRAKELPDVVDGALEQSGLRGGLVGRFARFGRVVLDQQSGAMARVLPAPVPHQRNESLPRLFIYGRGFPGSGSAVSLPEESGRWPLGLMVLRSMVPSILVQIIARRPG